MNTSNRKFVAIAFYAVLFLFFLQMLSDFIESIYAFGLLGTSLPIEMVTLLLLFSPLVLVVTGKNFSPRVLFALVLLFLLARVVSSPLNTYGRMLVSGFGVSCFLLLLPMLIQYQLFNDDKSENSNIGAGLVSAVALSILFRSINSGIDLTNHGWFQSINLVLALITGFILRKAKFQKQVGSQDDKTSAGGFCKTLILCAGLISVFILIYFAFMSPNVIARWTGTDYLQVLSVTMLSLTIWSFLYALPRHRIQEFLSAANLLFVVSIVLTIFLHQPAFPKAQAAHPFYQPDLRLIHNIPLWLTLLLFPVIFADFAVFLAEFKKMKTPTRMAGTGFTIGALFLLLLIFANIFTTVYDYIPVVGPFFRDKYWLVFLIPGIALLAAVLVSQKEKADAIRVPQKLSVGFVLLSIVIIASVYRNSARPEPLPDDRPFLKVATYNIQQGYDASGQRNYEGQLRILKEADADIIGLQETDTNRIPGGNADIIRYFADHLNMYAYYGPKTVTGTFGIAFLSKYPIKNPRTFFMYCQGEQTATIFAQINVGERDYNIFVTHLGNDGPIVQQQNVLQEVKGKENVILMGDFNFEPGTAQHNLATETLNDAWLVKWPGGIDDNGFQPEHRIDYIFLSKTLQVLAIKYLESGHSDHPAVFAEIKR